MAFNTSSWSVKEEVNKAKLKLEIPNFSDVVGNTSKGQRVISQQFDVGGAKFALKMYPNGQQGAEEGMLSAFLGNESNHDVVVDFTISVEGGKEKSAESAKIEKGMLAVYLRNESNHDVVVDFTISVEGGSEDSWENAKIEKRRKRGRRNFMRASEVGTDLKTIVEVELKWEDIAGGEVQQNQVTSRDLVQLEQRMKTFVRGEMAKVKATPIPECPVCFLQLKPPKKIVQCLKVGIYGMNFCFPIILTKIYAKGYRDPVDCRCTKLILV